MALSMVLTIFFLYLSAFCPTIKQHPVK